MTVGAADAGVDGGGAGAGAGGAGSGNGAAGAGAGAAAASDWTTGLSSDHRGLVQLKGFKDPSSLIDSYQSLEKHLGVPKERLLKLPEKDDSPEWGDIYNRLGRPASADEYKFEMPKEHGSEDMSKWAKATFHELGFTKKQAEALAGKWNEQTQGEIAKQQQIYDDTIRADETALKKEWGLAYQQNVLKGQQAARTFGIGPETIDKLEKGMGFAGLMKFMHQIGSGLGEHGFEGGGGGGGFGEGQHMTPEAAAYRIKELNRDPDFVKRYTSGDSKAKEEMNRLHLYAYPPIDEKR